MNPVNNCVATNEILQPISDTFLREKYGITEQYSKDHPEASVKVLSAVRSTEEALRAARESTQSSKKLTRSIIELGESSQELHTRLDRVIESSENNTQALRKLATSSSELKEMTSNIANFAKRFFNPVRNRFYILTGRREPAAVLPRENQLAIEDNPENMISDTDPTNQTSGDEKKNRKFTNVFCAFGRAILCACRGTKEFVMFLDSSSIKLISKINLWFRSKLQPRSRLNFWFTVLYFWAACITLLARLNLSTQLQNRSVCLCHLLQKY